MTRRCDAVVRETWLEAGLRLVQPYEMEDEFSAAYARHVNAGAEEAEAAVRALRDVGVPDEDEQEDI